MLIAFETVALSARLSACEVDSSGPPQHYALRQVPHENSIREQRSVSLKQFYPSIPLTAVTTPYDKLRLVASPPLHNIFTSACIFVSTHILYMYSNLFHCCNFAFSAFYLQSICFVSADPIRGQLLAVELTTPLEFLIDDVLMLVGTFRGRYHEVFGILIKRYAAVSLKFIEVHRRIDILFDRCFSLEYSKIAEPVTTSTRV